MKKNLFITFTIALFMGINLMSQENKQIKVLISTEFGDMTAVLYNETPKHRDNFVKLVNEGWFDRSPFHRVIQGFMIQGGQNADGRMDPGYKVSAEFVAGKYHKKGALAAARQADQVNPERASSGSQFYIVQGRPQSGQALVSMGASSGMNYSNDQIKVYETIGGTPHLDGQYTVFGEVISGLDVVDKIAAVKTAPGDKPLNDVTMTIKIID